MVTCFFVLVLWTFGFVYYLAQVPAKAQELDLSRYDALVVFTGGNGRIGKGIEFLQRVRAMPLLVSGVNTQVSAEKLLAPYGLSGDEQQFISLDYNALTTRQNIVETGVWARTHNHRRLLVITSYYHIPRSKTLFRQMTPMLDVSFYPVFPESEGFGYIVREYHKYVLANLNII